MMQCLYRHFDKDGQLLYVGISLSAIQRLAQHREASSWFNEITKVTIEHYETREEVVRVERETIQRENPKYNIKHRRVNLKPSNQQIDEARLTRVVTEYQPMYTPDEAANLLKVSVETVRLYIRLDKLGAKSMPARKASKRYLISGWQLIDFIENLPNYGDRYGTANE